MELEAINGNEIIDFLNTLKVRDISIVQQSYVFERQEINGDKYKLTFTGCYNNWGTDQPIPGNKIAINKKGEVFVYVDEPFDADGTADELEKALTEWLKTHTFASNSKEKFYSILKDSYEKLPDITFIDKEELQKIIDNLINAKTYMK